MSGYQSNRKGDVMNEDIIASVPDQHDLMDMSWAEMCGFNGIDSQIKPEKHLIQQWPQEDPWTSHQATDGVIPTMQSFISRDNMEDNLVQTAQQESVPPQLDEMQSWFSASDFEGILPADDCRGVSSAPAVSVPSSKPLFQGSVCGAPAGHQAARQANAAAHMALGAQRAAGLIHPTNGDAFNKVHTSSLPTIMTSGGNIKKTSAVRNMCTTAAASTHRTADGAGSGGMQSVHSTGPGLAGNNASRLESSRLQTSSNQELGICGVLPKKMPGVAALAETAALPPQAAAAPVNFSHFARPSHMFRGTNVQSTSAVICGAGTRKLFVPEGVGIGKTKTLSTGSSIVDSLTVPASSGHPGFTSPGTAGPGLTSIPPQQIQQTVKKVQSPSLQRNAVGNLSRPASRMALMQQQPPHQQQHQLPFQPCFSPFTTGQQMQRRYMQTQSTEHGTLSTVTSSAATGRRSANIGDAMTSSGGSGSGNGVAVVSERPGPSAISGKSKRTRDEETECETEDGDGIEDTANMKKSGPGKASGSTAKRSRAAEVHNLSERRRRDRINERMKALQELIPNSNKTDKASMLDEAIDYLKNLQKQIQMFSMMRAGHVGGNMPPLPQHAMGGLQQMPNMGLGLNPVGMNGPVGMNLGMRAPIGVHDVPSQSTQRLMMSLPSQSHGTPPYHVGGLPTNLAGGSHIHRSEASTVSGLDFDHGHLLSQVNQAGSIGSMDSGAGLYDNSSHRQLQQQESLEDLVAQHRQLMSAPSSQAPDLDTYHQAFMMMQHSQQQQQQQQQLQQNMSRMSYH